MIYTARAYAKTNLFLDVVVKREDGYHDINTVMQSLSLYDEISLELCESGIFVECDNQKLSGNDNIAYLACEKFLTYAKLNLGVRVNIKKNIPVAAGLGGGSADAAAVLILLNKASKVNLPIAELIPIAAKLGADVPFFLLGGTVKAQGIGERLEKLYDAEVNLVLLKQHVKQSTGAMYKMLDSLEIPNHRDINRFVDKLKQNDVNQISLEIFNSFEACWNMQDLSDPFRPFEPMKIFLSGSGPTVCALFADYRSADETADCLKKKGLEAYAVSSVPFGVEIV